MSSALEKLFFSIALIDKVSGPSKGVCQSFRQMQRQGKDAFDLLSKGALGVASSGIALTSLTDPARDMGKALKTVESLDAPIKELNRLDRAAKTFALDFGGDAAAVAAAAYDIQSAMPNLADGALAVFDVKSAILAKATKSEIDIMTKYSGTMYSIFEDEAKKMGDAKWIDQMVGKTAYAVKMFKTTGPEMQAAFSNLGSTGQKAGVSLGEQLAVLGTLQGTMGGANAGTAYKSFFNRVGQAKLQTKDGVINFADAGGKLLPMVEILEKIRKAVGPGQLKLADQTALMQAFGEEGGKAVLNLLDKTDALKGSISELDKIQNANPAIKMAKAMVDPYDRFLSSTKVLRISLGQGLLPVLNLTFNAMSSIIAVAVWMLDTIPGLKYAIGGVIIAVTLLTMAFSMFYIVVGVIKMFKALHGELRIVWAWCLRNAAATHSMTTAQRLNAITQMLWAKTIGATAVGARAAAIAQWLWTVSIRSGTFWQKISAIYSTLLAIATGRVTVQAGLATLATNGLAVATMRHTVVEKLHVLWLGLCRGAMIGYQVACFAVKAALLAGVIPAVIASATTLGAYQLVCLLATGVSWLLTVGLSAAAAAAWSFTAALLANPITWIVVGIVALIGALVSLVFYWTSVRDAAVATFEWIVKAAGWCWDKLTAGWSKFFDMIRSVGKIFGLLSGASAEVSVKSISGRDPVMPDLVAGRRNDVDAGGVRNTSTTNNNNWGGVRINVQGGMSPAELGEWLMLNT